MLQSKHFLLHCLTDVKTTQRSKTTPLKKVRPQTRRSTQARSRPSPASRRKTARRNAIRLTPFNLRRFFKQLKIAKDEQEIVTDCLTRGLAAYHRHIYGYDKYGSTPDFLIGERMIEPYIFGFGAVEVIRHTALPTATQLKIVQYTLDQIDATAEYGTPHGLPMMLSFLAEVGALEPVLFRSVMIAADFGGTLFDDWAVDEVRRLVDWLIVKADVAQAERLWWLWHISVNAEPPQIARGLAETVLGHSTLPARGKRALCEAWLTDAPAGQPPAQWEAMQALLSGDLQSFAAHAAEAGLPLPEGLPSQAAIEADYDAALDTLLDGEDDSAIESSPPSLHLLRKMLIGPLGLVVLTPGPLKRAAIAALPRLGDDPLLVCKRYLGVKQNYQADTLHQGVADVIRAYRHQMTEGAVRDLVEEGLRIGAAPTRKAYYQLGADLFGASYMTRAAQDTARSIREWAAKSSSGAARPRRGRKPVGSGVMEEGGAQKGTE